MEHILRHIGYVFYGMLMLVVFSLSFLISGGLLGLGILAYMFGIPVNGPLTWQLYTCFIVGGIVPTLFLILLTIDLGRNDFP